ncbi:hypothetical protein BYZ73_10900 [Rhodovulum viride]|uniref:Response regulatory domain-containing protein n=1 Tax=Rhodovulum viride TaxID=1231134 RepID=A0ABX9DGB6_9RHOB|nr:hypothetical protein BYZ73_10900 [Rhodovulum viride]
MPHAAAPFTTYCPTYVVLERDALISADLIQAIESLGPCRVMHFSSIEQVTPALEDVGAVDAAFLEMRVDDALSSGLAAHLAKHGARLVLTLGEDVERVMGEGWRLLLRPFTERMVHDALIETSAA